jgi:hypothetical protein
MVHPQLNNHNKFAMDGALLVGVVLGHIIGEDWMKLLCIYCTWMTFSYLPCPHWSKVQNWRWSRLSFGSHWVGR